MHLHIVDIKVLEIPELPAVKGDKQGDDFRITKPVALFRVFISDPIRNCGAFKYSSLKILQKSSSLTKVSIILSSSIGFSVIICCLHYKYN